ncbi:sugar transporter ERD6-like 6 [Hyposmocoma kahamanoa]|uniref:sugar transporter ERD6-like 6 n=1 Tax=Hyposmocoma kahamanoa TaxID=1477025 RepID=UPI000E6D9438|nr:sugar transporter ERD6-like 6 [Hyposmocoma kahamanoa]
MGILNQIICTLIASFLCFILGLSYAWPSSTMRLFQSDNTTLERPMGPTEIALFGSLSSIGALVGTPPIGIFLDIIGRKYCAMAAGLMSVLAWTIITTCIKVEAILVAIFLSGVGGAVVLVVPVYVGEICQESIRGTMTSSSMIFYGIGMLASYVLGGYLEYKLMVYICLSLTILGVIMLLFLRETPLYLMKKGMDKEAQKSFAFYRNAAFDSKIVLQEMDTLRRAFNPVMDDDGGTTIFVTIYISFINLQAKSHL